MKLKKVKVIMLPTDKIPKKGEILLVGGEIPIICSEDYSFNPHTSNILFLLLIQFLNICLFHHRQILLHHSLSLQLHKVVLQQNY